MNSMKAQKPRSTQNVGQLKEQHENSRTKKQIRTT